MSLRLLCSVLLISQCLAGGRLLATGGVSQLEGAAGGGLTPWALIAGYGTRDEVAGTAFITGVRSQGFKLTAAGAAVGWQNRLEFSYARQRFGLGDTVPGQSIRQDIFGAKWRLAGDAVIDQDQPWPQLALGIMHKRNRDFAGVPQALGARRGHDNELYLAASKIWLHGLAGHTTLLNLTLRHSRANQLGILGFGGDRNSHHKLLLEGSLAWFVNDHWLVGGEWRQKPDNLSVFKEQRYADVFVAWLPNKQLALTLAHAELGNIANRPSQRGPYLSLKFDW